MTSPELSAICSYLVCPRLVFVIPNHNSGTSWCHSKREYKKRYSQHTLTVFRVFRQPLSTYISKLHLSWWREKGQSHFCLSKMELRDNIQLLPHLHTTFFNKVLQRNGRHRALRTLNVPHSSGKSLHHLMGEGLKSSSLSWWACRMHSASLAANSGSWRMLSAYWSRTAALCLAWRMH